MEKIKLFVAICFVFVFSSLSSLLATSQVPIILETMNFSDVPENHWAASYIKDVVGRGFMKGDGKGIFRPDANVSHAEVLQVIMNLYIDRDMDVTQPPTTSAHGWYRNAVLFYLKQINSYYRIPHHNDKNWTEGKASRIFVAGALFATVNKFESLGSGVPGATYSDIANVSEFEKTALGFLSGTNIINGYPDGSFGPNRPITRAEFAKILSNYTQYFSIEEAPDEIAYSPYGRERSQRALFIEEAKKIGGIVYSDSFIKEEYPGEDRGHKYRNIVILFPNKGYFNIEYGILPDSIDGISYLDFHIYSYDMKHIKSGIGLLGIRGAIKRLHRFVKNEYK